MDLITGKLKKEIDQALGDVLLRSSNSVSEAIDRVENQVHARIASNVLSAGAISKL